MVGTNLKAETMALMDERDAMESEMNSIIHRLCQEGGPGLSANLVDSEGFPRADINIPAVRADRQHLAELRIDHKNLMEKINQNIQLLHAAKLGPKLSTPMGSDDVDRWNTAVLENVDTTGGIPFAMVDEIAEASPAAEDGLQIGDQMVKFGSVESGENLIPRLASEVQKNQGSATSVVVMRQGVLTSVYITPRTWDGSGLLGCHFKFL